MSATAVLSVRDLTLAYDGRVIQQGLDFDIPRGSIFVIMGGSGCGKSTLLRHLIGLQQPAGGRVLYGGDTDFWAASPGEQDNLKRRFGVLFQAGALWSSLTLAENVALPLEEFTDLPATAIREIVAIKLALVGLSGFENHYPAEISGGMKKRAGLARAMALDPEILFCDEPSAGLDPLSARRLDELLLELRARLGTTIVLVTHELASIFAVATDSIFLDAESRTMIASGNPHHLAQHGPALVRNFLARGEEP